MLNYKKINPNFLKYNLKLFFKIASSVCLLINTSILSNQNPTTEEQLHNLEELEEELEKAKDELHEFYFFHNHEFTKSYLEGSFRDWICTTLNLPQTFRIFLNNSTSHCIKILKDYHTLIERAREIDLDIFKIIHPNADKERIDNYKAYLKTIYANYTPKINVEHDGPRYEFRKEISLFCQMNKIFFPYFIFEAHSEKCYEDKEYCPGGRMLHTEKKADKNSFKRFEFKVHALYKDVYLKRYPYDVVIKENENGREVIVFSKKREAFHTWLNELFQLFIQKNKINKAKLTLQDYYPIFAQILKEVQHEQP